MFQKFRSKCADLFNSFRARAAAISGAGLALVAAPPAFAAGGGSGGLTAAALDKLAGLEADVTSILVVLVGVIFLFVLYSMIKRAR